MGRGGRRPLSVSENRDRTTVTRALVLVGHGSHLSPTSSAPVYAHAERIRASGLFDEVIEGFWKEEPSLRDVLALVESDEVYVVPVFLAEGYFTGQVVPRELGLPVPAAAGARPRVHYCPPVGAHQAMGDLVLRRALEQFGSDRDRAGDAALVIIGHGTNRSATSGDTVYRLVDSLRATGEFGFVTCGFLDEDPSIADVIGSLDAADVVLVPYFVADGWHTADTIPRDLSLTGARTDAGGRTLWYTPPVGTLPEIAEVVLSIAGDAGAFDQQGRADSQNARPPRPITLARRRFLDWLDSADADGRDFLQLNIRHRSAGGYEVTHIADRLTERSLLARSTDPRVAIEIARTNALGAYRPLRFADDLVTGWILSFIEPASLWQAVSHFYPAAVLHWHQAATGDTRPVSYTRWAHRQSGLYDGLRFADNAVVEEAIGTCCGSCLRFRGWSSDAGPVSAPLPDTDKAVVPCREPCTLFAATTRERLVTVALTQ